MTRMHQVSRHLRSISRLLSSRTFSTDHLTEFAKLPQPSIPPTFKSLKLHPLISSALEAIRIHEPTYIQREAAPQIRSGSHSLVAAETGAGKTIAYLAPILSNIKQNESSNASIQELPNRPSVLVLLPTRQLVGQVASVAKSLSHVMKLRVRAFTGGSNTKAAHRLRKENFDILVSTPGAVLQLRDRGLLYLSRIRTVVLDEADELLADRAQFSDQLDKLLPTLREKGAQHVYVAATVPNELEQSLRKRHGSLSVVKGQRLHRVSDIADVNTTFIRVDGGDEAKFFKLKEVVTSAVQRSDCGKILIFCDDDARRKNAVERLLEQGVETVHLHSGGGSKQREEQWEKFADANGAVAGVCSKSYGRGIDHSEIKTVILMDVPMTGGEYVHRIGRIRGKGRAYVLVKRREHAIAESLFLLQVQGKSMTRVSPSFAWKEYVNAGQDRLSSEVLVRKARSSRRARWVDERVKAKGTFRGSKGRATAEKVWGSREQNRSGRNLSWG